MQKVETVSKFPVKLARIVLKTIAFLLLFILVVFLLLLTPPVQRVLTAKVQHYLENKLHTKVAIGRISFGLSGRIGLRDVYIEDRARDTLVAGGVVRARLNYLKLFSNEVRIKDLEMENITARIKRILPDTVYNFQFIVDAFTSESSKNPDTSSSPPMKLDIDALSLKNVNLTYTDAVAGSDMFAHIGEFAASIDTLDPYTQHFVLSRIMLRNSKATVKQVKPLVEPKPLEEHIAKAVTPSPMKVQFGNVVVEKVSFEYTNDVSAIYTSADIGELRAKERLLDLANNTIDFETISLNKSAIVVRLGKTQQAKVVKQEVKKEAVAQQQAGWNVLVSNFDMAGNTIRYDDDNMPKLSRGLDYSHISANNLTLLATDLRMNPDSVSISIKKGTVNEKSGLIVEQLQGDVLYAQNESYLRNFYLKTPGTEIKRAIALDYPSLEMLVKNPEKTNVRVELVQSKVQVKDILLFAPQLRSNPAMKDPNDVWTVDLVGNGTMNQFNIETLQFAGLSNTQVNAHGSLTGLIDPKNAGGNFVIERFHTNQRDVALFAGDQLSKQPFSLPRDISMRGTVSGSAGVLNTKMYLLTSDGTASVNGRFAEFRNPAYTQYNAVISTGNLQLGKILRQPEMVGSFTGTVTVNGRGLTPETINTNFSAAIASAGFNQYQYRNINLAGSLHKTDFEAKASIKDPNADADFFIAGNFSDHPAFSIDGMVDSIKTQPLHFTTEPLVVRGKIHGQASDLSADNVTANILLTQALLVSGANRLPLDTVQLESGRNDTANFITLRSSIVNASVTGQYRLADLGDIVMGSVQPYFQTGATGPQRVKLEPYRFNFTADVMYNPILSAFVPGLVDMKTLHASGNFSENGGMNAVLTTPYILYQGNAVTDLNVTANTGAGGLQIAGNVAHLKSGNSYDIYNLRLNATALNNTINFDVGIDDANARNKYFIGGLITQPSSGTYAIQLKPDGLRLNYQSWTVSPDNLVTISPDNIVANNLVLQNGNQRLSINSPVSRGKQLLVVDFSNFRLATVTGFIKADSVLADGLINGNVRLTNFLEQPNFAGDLTINDLSLKNDTVGNVAIHASTTGLNRYDLEATITGRGNDVSMSGWVANTANAVNLNLDLTVRALQLKTIEEATAGAMKNLSGSVNGNVSIRGNASQPDVNGSLNFEKASFAMTMLGSQFHLDNQKLIVNNDGFAFNNFTITDSSGNSLALNGNILTNNFVNYEFDLKVTAKNFELLNSTKKDNPIYYGKMNISSNMVITGTELKPVVDGGITVNDGTSLTFVVPQPDAGPSTRDGIVEFVDMSNPAADTLFKAYDSLDRSAVLGMDIALNIEVKKEAIFNIVVDAANGDFLNAQGEALLTAGIDPSGKITLTGSYTLEKGAYQLSFNFLQRKFEIVKGSTITWTGEPTTAELNVSAVYIANTSPLDLVEKQVEGTAAAVRNTYLQKLPFELHLNLTGELMKPVVAFDIMLPDDRNYGVSNDVVTTVQYKLAQLREDPGETNKQVFSLLLLNRFVGENPFSSSGSGFNAGTYARQSASKLLTEQLNQLAAGLINGVDIDFDVASTEDYTTGSMRNRTDLNMNVSKRLLNERLKISVGSNFELEGPQNTNQQSNNIAGNVAIDYQLSRDGRYMIRYFRKNNYEGEVDGYVIENGLSFIISVDYNRFSQLLHKRKQRVQGIDNKQKELTQ